MPSNSEKTSAVSDSLESEIGDRLQFIEDIKQVFAVLHPENPRQISRGIAQREVLDCLGRDRGGWNRRTVSEALKTLGYRNVKIRGHHFYRK